MPIGKNAIKRVTVSKADAPEIKEATEKAEEKVAPKKAEASPKKVEAKASPKTSAPKKAPAKKPSAKTAAPKKSMESEPTLSPVKTLETVTSKKEEASVRRGDGYINLGGGDLPYYLL